MPLLLQSITIQNAEPIGLVQFAMGEADDLTPSRQWLTGQIRCDGSNMKSVALLQIIALRQLRDLVGAEIQRLSGLYQEAEKAQD